jgi:hypothetical protein
LPGRSNTQQDVESHDAPLIAELSALAISGDGPAPSGVAIYNPIGFSPAEASTQPPPLTGQHDKYYHGYNNQSFQLDGNAQVSSPEAYHTMRSVTPSPSSPSLFYQDDHAVFEPGSPSHTSDIGGGFTSSSTSAPSPSGPDDPVLDGFLRSIYEQGALISYAHKVACMTKYSGRSLPVNANVIVHVHARLPSRDALIRSKKEPNTFSDIFLPCSLSSPNLVPRYITLAPPSPDGRNYSPIDHPSHFPSVKHKLPFPRSL